MVSQEEIRREIRRKAELSYSRSSGPGGQNVNKRDTKVTAHLFVDDLISIDENDRSRLRRRLSRRLTTDGALVVQADGERSQGRNRSDALERLEEMIIDALRPDSRPRRPTKPSKAAKERRLESKRRRAAVKSRRGRVSNADD